MTRILAGPILRRVERSQINIWIASSEPMKFIGRLYDRHLSDPELSAHSSFRTVKLGDKLFVHLIKICPEPGDDPFPQDELLYYDILIEHADGSQESVVRKNPYFTFPETGHPELPGFFIPRQLKRVLHGSCRRPHAKQALPGWARLDQLGSGADLINSHFDDLDERPAALFLTGDQIYADDVAMPVLAMLIARSKALTGWQERMPIDSHGGEVVPAETKLDGRMHALKLNRYGITSTAADNHLLTFAEYAGIYLAVLGGETDLPKKPFNRIHGNSRDHYNRDKERAEAFFAGRQSVRRLLANIPVYMIFDDHEVTDDWNLNPAWEAKIYGNPFARRMVSNALAAYWAFQGWGNDPDKFDDQFMDTIQAHLSARQVTGPEADAFEAALLSRQPVDRWSYTLPTDPFTVVLDTRMHRAAGSAGSDGPSALMDAGSRQWLGQALQNHRDDAGKPFPLLLISAAPVFGFARMERLQKIAAKLGISDAELDRESWREGFAMLERVIAADCSGVQSVTILSGDVHYSFSSRGAFLHNQRSISAAQLTSSPLSNLPSGGVIGKALLHVEEDDDYPDLLPAEETAERITALNNIGLVLFADDGRVARHILVARRRNSESAKRVLTFIY